MKVLLPQKESIIDGETDFEYETDEDGNVIDPPEDYIPPTSKHSSETTQSSHTGESSQAHPGETTKADPSGRLHRKLKAYGSKRYAVTFRTTERQLQRLLQNHMDREAVKTTAASSFNLETASKKRM